jgi:arsenate reductase
MPHYSVLFLCTGNSARSIMAEAIMNRKGRASFTAFSAGSHPTGAVRPEAIRQLEMAGLNAADVRSKSWDEFSRPDCPILVSCSRFATTRRRRYVRFGLGSR